VWGSSQLLRVYLDYDLLQPAAALFMEYLEGLLGVLQGSDAPAFGLKGVLDHSNMSVWVPYTCADQLLRALQEHQDDPFLLQLYRETRDKIEQYQGKLTELSATS